MDPMVASTIQAWQVFLALNRRLLNAGLGRVMCYMNGISLCFQTEVIDNRLNAWKYFLGWSHGQLVVSSLMKLNTLSVGFQFADKFLVGLGSGQSILPWFIA